MNNTFEEPKKIASMAIDASAGCGKTEELSLRLIGIFLSDPESLNSVLAMTFTRSAAGEIYERVLSLLYEAALAEEKFAKLKERLIKLGDGIWSNAAQPDLVWHGHSFAKLQITEVKQLLSQLIMAMNTVRICTLDSFMSQIVQAFPFELGLPGQGEIINDHEFAMLHYKIISELFKQNCPQINDDDFLENCKDSSFGTEQKMFFDSCSDILLKLKNFYRCRNEAAVWEYWSNIQMIASNELNRAWDELKPWAEAAPKRDLFELFEHCSKSQKNENFSKKELKIIREFIKFLPDICAGNSNIKPASFTRGYDYSAILFPLGTLIAHARNILLYQCAVRTGGMRKLLCAYVGLYEKYMTKQGKIIFSDLPQLLCDTDNDYLYDINYRLNGKINHFLIDEFQDTSHIQWEVFNNIIDGAQDLNKSMFIVGDVKQAIYSWREGDSKLMGQVINDYALPQAALTKSFRYGEDICIAINRLFSARNMDSSPFAPGVKSRWNTIFKPHTSAKTNQESIFKVYALLPPENDIDDEKTSDETVVSLKSFAAIIKKELDIIRPLDNQASCGILVRNKKDGPQLKEYLIELDNSLENRIVWESDISISSDHFVAALLSLLVYLQHPSDTLSLQIVKMSLSVRHLLNPDEIAPEKQSQYLSVHGFYLTLKNFIEQLNVLSQKNNENTTLRTDFYQNGNVEILLKAAQAFDSIGGTDALDFRDFVSKYKQSDAALNSKIRIMTIHHSKGLGFDFVFVPLDNDTKYGNLRRADLSGFFSKESGDGRLEWLLNQPREEGYSIPQIAEAIDEKHDADVFEEICCLYVALTRAKKGMYLLLPVLNKGKYKIFNAEKKKMLIADAEKESYYISDYVWDSLFLSPKLQDIPSGTINQVAGTEVLIYTQGVLNPYARIEVTREDNKIAPLQLQSLSTKGRKRRVNPSMNDNELSSLETRRLFFHLPDERSGAGLGVRLHSFFEKVETFDSFVIPPDAAGDILEHFYKCAANPKVVELLNINDLPPWRERRFEIILDDAWISGCFDRVAFQTAANGKIERVYIIDYKSNDITPDMIENIAAKYQTQMQIYRRVCSKILNISPNCIKCVLIFTKIGECYEF